MPRHDHYDDDDTLIRDRNDDRSYRDRDRFRARSGFRDGMARREGGSRYDNDRDRGLMDDRGRGRDPRFGSDAYRDGIAMDETRKLIASNKVEGTPVYDRSGDRCGSIHNFMVDKRRGEVVYAVLKHSAGFLGFDDRYYPLQWDELTYDTRLDGYRVDLDQDELARRGSFNSLGHWSSGREARDQSDRSYNSHAR